MKIYLVEVFIPEITFEKNSLIIALPPKVSDGFINTETDNHLDIVKEIMI